MGRVAWSDAAIADVDAITDYVANFNLAAAKRLRQTIFDAGVGLAEFPSKGSMSRDGTRRWGLVYPYAIHYRIDRDDVLILRVRHGARQLI